MRRALCDRHSSRLNQYERLLFEVELDEGSGIRAAVACDVHGMMVSIRGRYNADSHQAHLTERGRNCGASICHHLSTPTRAATPAPTPAARTAAGSSNKYIRKNEMMMIMILKKEKIYI